MGTYNICIYKVLDKKYIGCNLKTTESLDCALIGVCAVIRSNTVSPKLIIASKMMNFFKQCSVTSDAADHGIRSVSSLFTQTLADCINRGNMGSFYTTALNLYHSLGYFSR